VNEPRTTPTHPTPQHTFAQTGVRYTAKPGGQQRRIRWFVGLHLAAVGTVYAVASSIGGGWNQPMPPLPGTLSTATTPVTLPMDAKTDTRATGASQPEWTQRAELAAPWEPPQGSQP
jgi:hypothetical protein